MMITSIATSALYRLMAWLSPAFPVGGFSYSHALEYAVEAGAVRDRESLRAYVAGAIAHGSGRGDAILLVETWRAVCAGDTAQFTKIAEIAAALRGTAELTLESTAQGQAFLSTVDAAWPELDLAPWRKILAAQACAVAYPVAVGAAAARAGLGVDETALGYLHAFAAALVTAGVKLVPLGQTDGQRVLAALESIVAAIAAEACASSLDDLGAAAPAIDLWSMRHETQYTRLFRS
jgi:urease accessory protein